MLTEQTALLRGRLAGQRSRRVITRGSMHLAVHLRCTPGRTRCGLAGDANAMCVSDEMTTDQAAC